VWYSCGSVEMDAVLDSMHPLHCIRWNGDGPTPFARVHLIARSHAVLQTLELEDYPLEDIMNRLANSAKLSRLTTIIMLKISLSLFIGGHFPSLHRIEAQKILDLSLLRDPAFLPTLRSVSLTCDNRYQLEDTTILQNSNGPDHTHVSLQANRSLLYLNLDMRDIVSTIAGDDDLVGDEVITGYNHYFTPFHLPKLSSL